MGAGEGIREVSAACCVGYGSVRLVLRFGSFRMFFVRGFNCYIALYAFGLCSIPCLLAMLLVLIVLTPFFFYG